ncbi:hypothetical protein VTN49DRAFT_2614 [Thermomyces lanuginosus]|uniref:uncharacterized protein n=1 Tax=Thermomyces lanuginosus TaxID=5541 RepID=UPI00374445DD
MGSRAQLDGFGAGTLHYSGFGLGNRREIDVLIRYMYTILMVKYKSIRGTKAFLRRNFDFFIFRSGINRPSPSSQNLVRHS